MEAFFDEQHHPLVKLTVSGSKKKRLITAIFDTGFDGFLSIPITTAIALGLELSSVIRAQYADGRVAEELEFNAYVELDGHTQKVKATLTGSVEALAGTQLFAKKKVSLDFLHKSIRISDA